MRSRVGFLTVVGIVSALIFVASAAAAKEDAPRRVTAKLVDIPGKFPPDDLYDYAYVMKYQVLKGDLPAKSTILVAHYKPRQKRSKITGKVKKYVAGKVKHFRKGDVHELTLVKHSRKIWKGAMVDDYFAKDRKSTRYWALRTDPASAK